VPIDPDAPALYMSVQVDGTELHLGGPEQERADAQNEYRPAWVPLEEVDGLELVPDTAREAVRAIAPSHFTAPAADDGGDA
jgi:type II secretory pathway component PulK